MLIGDGEGGQQQHSSFTTEAEVATATAQLQIQRQQLETGGKKKKGQGGMAEPLLGGHGESKAGGESGCVGTQVLVTSPSGRRVVRRQAFAHEGYLWKRGKLAGRMKIGGRFEWKRRYCVLINTKMYQYSDEEEYR